MQNQPLPIDHPGLPVEYERTAHRVQREQRTTSIIDIANTLMIAGVLWVLVHFALTIIELRGLRTQIYLLTEQAIKTQVPACSVESVGGIKVEHCVRTVAQ